MILLWFAAWAWSAPVRVSIVDLRNDDGLVHIALYASPEGFPMDGHHALRSRSVPIRNGRAECEFLDVPPGTYAIGFLHDENRDEVMQKNLVGVPREGYGASNDATRTFGPPRFADASFVVGEDAVPMVLHPVYWLAL